MKKTVELEIKTFGEDKLRLGVDLQTGKNPFYFVQFNDERIGGRWEKYGSCESRFNDINRVLQMTNKVHYCDLCDDYVEGVKKYYMDEDKDWTESLCPKCLIKQRKTYKTITEVTE